MTKADESTTTIVSHASALVGIRRARANYGLVPWSVASASEQHRAERLATALKRRTDVGELVRQGFWQEGEPFDLLISDPQRNGRAREIHARTRTQPLGANALLVVKRNLYCAAPHLIPAQLIEAPIELVRLASIITELCSSFTLDTPYMHSCDNEQQNNPALHHGYSEAEPATSMGSITRAMRRTTYGKRARITKQTLEIAIQGCCSPMEAIMGMLFHAPMIRGGFGLQEMRMNYRIDFNETARSASGMPYCICDAYVPKAHITLEYNGSDHDGRTQRIHDERRTAGLHAMGIITIPINDRQLKDIEALEAIAMTIHRRIYGYYRNQVAAQRVRQIELLNSLRTSYGLAPC